MINEQTIDTEGGHCCPTFDDQPLATTARVRPFIWALLLLTAAVRPYEVVEAMSGRVHGDDIRTGDDPLGRTPLEAVVDEAICELVEDKTLRPRGDGLFVLNSSARGKAISTSCVLNAQLPDHLLADLAAGR